MKLSGRLIRALEHGQVPGRTLPKGAQWIGHDIPGRGSASKRRLQQMAKGQIPRICSSCHTDTVPKDRVLGICDGCLAKKWDQDFTKGVDTR